MVNCPNCGNDAGESKFCPNCGTKIEIEKPKSICPNCGNDVGESKFCPNCGTKIEIEKPKSFCPKCGTNVGESKFCPNCGTKIGGQKANRTCPSCGKSLSIDMVFCPYCGWSESKNESDRIDKIIDIDERLSDKFFGAMGKSKTVDKVFEKGAHLSKKYNLPTNSLNMAYWEKIDPLFVEFLNSIDDEYVKIILIIERNSLASPGGMVLGAVPSIVLSSVYTPTKDMTHDEGIAFYQEWADNIAADINKEKQNGTFDEEKYIKERSKATLENASFIGIPKSYKNWKDNQQ